MSLSRQSLALVLTTQNKLQKIHQKDKINKLTLSLKKTLKNPKPKLAGPNTCTAHMCVPIISNQ